MTNGAASGVQGPPGAPPTGRRPFPALDPEPPPRPVRARVLTVVAAVAAVAAVAGLVVWLLIPGGPRRPAAAARPAVPLPGVVIVLQPDGILAAARPDGRISRAFPGLGRFEQSWPSASADGRYLALPSGRILRVAAGGLAASRLDASRFVAPYSSVVSVGAFADGDRYVVTRGSSSHPGFQAPAPVSAAPLGAGSPVPLGSADRAAGDPQAAGAFVTVAASGPVASATPVLTVPDVRVERRDAGQPPVTLATTAQLLTVVGAPAGQLSLLALYPSPRGDAVAVVVAPDTRSPSNAGLVVLGRDGRVLGSVSAGIGPSGSSPPAWSPDGRSLAFVTAGDRGPELTIWTPGGSTTTSTLPDPASATGVCVWAPDGGGVLFASAGGPSSAPAWTVVLRHGAVITTTGPGYPLLWSGGAP